MKTITAPLYSLIRILTCLTILLATQAYANETCQETCDIDIPPVDSTASYVTVFVPDEGSVFWDGNITSHLIETTEALVSLIDTGEGSYCEIGNYEFCYNIAGNPDSNDLIMGCNRNTYNGALDCELASQAETPAPSPYTIVCDYYDGGKQCTITSDPALFVEQLPIAPDSNWGRIAGEFLSCLNGAFGSAEAMCSQVISALQHGDDELAAELIKALAPLSPSDAGNISRGNLNNANNVILQRTAQLRSGNTTASNVSTQLFLTSNQWLEAGARLAANDSLASDVTPTRVSTSISDFGKLGFFINLNVTDGKYKDGSLSSNSDFTSTMLTLGFDYRVRNDLVTGLAFNIGQSKNKYKAAPTSGEMSADSYSFIIYNSFYKNNWYFDTALTIGGDSYNQSRDIATGGLNNSFEAEYHSVQYNLSATVGYDFYFNSFNIAPFAQLSIGKLEIDGYREKETGAGGVGAELVMNDHSRDLGSFNAGAHFRYIFTTNNGVFIPVITLTAVNDFETDAQVITGRFVGVSSASTDGFEIKTEKSDSNYFVVGAGFTFQLKNGNAGFLNIESLQGYENLDQTRLTLGWRWEL